MNGRNISLGITFIVIIAVIVTGFYFLNKSPRPNLAGTTFQKTQVFTLKEKNNSPLNILATILPRFVVSLTDSKFSNVWTAYAQNVDTTVVNAKGEKIKADTTYDSQRKQLIVTPQSTNDFNPGLYKLNVKVKTYNGKDIAITQDFTWGVLAINTSKATYKPGEIVKIGMGVLDNKGNTKCIAQGNVAYNTAKVWLTITGPSGKTQNLSTDEGTIVGSKECAPTSVTNNPDFQAQITAGEVGRYTIHMTAQNINGTRSSDDYFTVSNQEQPFVIMRTSYPTRIYPYGNYPVEITVIANQNYSGNVSDFVPSNFKITDISEGGTVIKVDNYQQLNWHVNWMAGQTYTLDYTIKFPFVSPEFYLVGPLTIGSYSEGREWQIASDAISLVQSNFAASSASANTLSVTLPGALTVNDVIVIVCAEAGSTSINTPATNISGWSTGFSANSGSPRIRAFYHTIRASESTTYTCRWTSTNSNPKSIQVFEYSGLATSTTRDVGSAKTQTTCTSGSFTTNTINTTNPIELIFASEVSNNNPFRTVNSHSAGYTTETAFSGTFGTYTTADQDVGSTGSYNDTVTFSSSAGNCAGGIVCFNVPISTTQNGFQFFENNGLITPSTAIGIQNQNLTLPTPHAQFRVRMLLDVDGIQTIALQTADFELDYATLSAQFSGCDDPSISYDPVSTPGTHTDIAYYKNGLGSGVNISASGSDPVDTVRTITYTNELESYYEDDGSGPNGPNPGDITNDQNPISGNQAGLWDFSLVDNTSDIQSNTYCLKIANAGGGDLSAYDRYPEVTTFYNEVNILGGTTIKAGTTIK